MNTQDRDNRLDEALASALGGQPPKADFARWRETHAEAVEQLASAATAHPADTGEAAGLADSAGRQHNAPTITERIFKMNRIPRIAAAIIIMAAVAGTAAFLTLTNGGASVAWADVQDNMLSVQSIRAQITFKRTTGQAYAKRPNKLRIDHSDGTYEISNGPTLWVVDPKANKAVSKPSYYFRDAQRRGVDVLDMLAGLQYTDNFSGFFSEGPAETITRDGKTLDVYRMEIDEPYMRFEAIVDHKSQLPNSIELTTQKNGERRVIFALTALEYDSHIDDGMFEFKRGEGMSVTTEEAPWAKSQPSAAQRSTGGSTLSGRIVWASNDKPVGGARVRLGGWGSSLRAETDRDGRWRLAGVPAGRIDMVIRSWELNWPSVPTFANNIGSLKSPVIRVDGNSKYRGLNFRVYKPKDFYARITINVTDENGKPLPGIRASVTGRDWYYGQHLYAPGGRGKQYSDASGRFEATNIWPMDEPVRVTLGHQEQPSPYAAWAAMSEPFVIKSKQSYQFDMVVPFARQVKLKVVGPAGNPVEGLVVKALAGPKDYLTHILALASKSADKQKTWQTDTEGVVTLDQFAPEKEASVTLMRMPVAKGKGLRKPVASAYVAIKGPKERQSGEVTVIFDDRPIRIEGSFDSPPIPPGTSLSYVYCTVDGFRSNWWSWAKEGPFVLEGLPPGDVRLGFSFHGGDSREFRWKDCTPPLHLEPGNSYTVKIVGDKVEVIGRTPIPTSKETTADE